MKSRSFYIVHTLLCVCFCGSINTYTDNQYTIRAYNKKTDENAIETILSQYQGRPEMELVHEVSDLVMYSYGHPYGKPALNPRDINAMDIFLDQSIFQGYPNPQGTTSLDKYTTTEARTDVVCVNNKPINMIFYYFSITKFPKEEVEKMREYCMSTSTDSTQSSTLSQAIITIPLSIAGHESARIPLLQSVFQKLFDKEIKSILALCPASLQPDIKNLTFTKKVRLITHNMGAPLPEEEPNQLDDEPTIVIEYIPGI